MATETDIYLVQKLLGWRKIPDPIDERRMCWELPKSLGGLGRYLRADGDLDIHVPRFSDRILDAFEIEARMNNRGWSVRLSRSGQSAGWVCEFFKDGVQGDWSGYTLPETVCGAARAALEADED